MASQDFVDSILRICDNDLSNKLFASGFQNFHQRQFGSTEMNFKPAEFIYMLYGALCTLPLTTKITELGSDGLLLSKYGNNILLIISYAKPDRSLSLKSIRLSADMNMHTPILEKNILDDIRQKLESVKSRKIEEWEFDSALDMVNVVKFHRYGESVRTRIFQARIMSNRQSQVDTASKFPKPMLIRQGFRAQSTAILVTQLQSEVYDVVKYNSHALTRLLTLQHQIVAPAFKQDMPSYVRDVYAFLIGAIEMNWALSSRLNLIPVVDMSSKSVTGLMIGHDAPVGSWKAKTVPFFIQLLTSSSQSHEDGYDRGIYSQMMKAVPALYQPVKIVAIGVELEKLSKASENPIMNIPRLELLPYTLLLDLDPMENIVNLLLHTSNYDTLPKIEYCIKTLNGKGYGLHTYLYGQLMSKTDIDKFVYSSSTSIYEVMTTFAFKYKVADYAVIFDIYQKTTSHWKTNVKNILPTEQGFKKKLLHVTVHLEYINNQNHLISLKADLLDYSDFQRRGMAILTNWLTIPSVDARDVLLNLEGHHEAFHQLQYSDLLSYVLDSVDRDLLRHLDKMSFRDIIPFFAGLFSDWDKISYQDFLGIIKNDGSPLFISSLQTGIDNQEHLAGQTLIKAGNEYLIKHYMKNAFRRVANFILITLTPESRNNFGIARLSTYEAYRHHFESCLARRSLRMKRNPLLTITCLDHEQNDVEETSYEEESNDVLPKGIVSKSSKLGSYLKPIEKVSRTLMTVQIFKDIIGALLRGDYKTFAFNTAFLASGPLLESLSMKIVAKGVSLGSSLLGRSLLITAPFLGRLPVMGFVGFDLYEQIKAYRTGSTGAMVNIAGDSTILAIDFATASIEGAESLGIVSGVAEITGPIGFAVGTAIFVGMDVYSAAKTVSNIDAMVHLTGWQKFTTGFFSFLHVSPTKAVRQELFEKNAMDASIENAVRFFKDHRFVKYYIFPSYQENGDFVIDNIIDLTTKVTRMAHSWPKDVADTRLICAGNNNLRVDKTSKLLLNCSNSFGYESDLSANDLVVIFMSDGNDEVRTFNDKSTTFLIGDGHKYVVGSTGDDMFILTGNATSGHFDGRLGKNVLNLANYAPNHTIQVNFLSQQLIKSDQVIEILNINGIIGRHHDQEIIICDCGTELIDAQGGGDTKPDIVTLKKGCSYTTTTITINGTMRIKNEAEKGIIQYLIQGDHQAVISSVCRSAIGQKFWLGQKIEDLNELEIISLDNASLCHNVTIQSGLNRILKLGNMHHGAIFAFDDSEMRINNGTVLISAVSNDTITRIYEKFVTLAKKFDAVINVFSTKENINMLFGSGKAIHHANSGNDNHINILPNDPYHITYLVGGVNQNVFRISMPFLYNSTCNLDPIRPIIIVNYAKNNYMNVVDLYEIILLIQEQMFGYVVARADIQNLDILISVYAGCADGKMFNIANVTLENALEDKNYEKIVINMRRPMTIRLKEKSVILVPADYRIPSETYVVIHRGLIEPYTTVVSPRILGKYNIFKFNESDLILTNLEFVDKESEATVIILKDARRFKGLVTLRFKFEDQAIRLTDHIGRNDFEDFENLLL